MACKVLTTILHRVLKQLQCSLNLVIYANYLKEISFETQRIYIAHNDIKKAATNDFVTA